MLGINNTLYIRTYVHSSRWKEKCILAGATKSSFTKLFRQNNRNNERSIIQLAPTLSNSETRNTPPSPSSLRLDRKPIKHPIRTPNLPNNPNSNSAASVLRAAVYDFRFTTSCGRGRTRSELPAQSTFRRSKRRCRSMAEPNDNNLRQFKGPETRNISR